MENNKRNILRFPADWTLQKDENKKISIVTAYDAAMGALVEKSNIDAIIVGDSLGMVVQGHKSTIHVTLEEMIYHCRLVRKGAGDLFLIGDMPFGTYQSDVDTGLKNAFKMMKRGLVDAIKVEGTGKETLLLIKRLKESGVPVMGHIGLTPQSYLTLGGFRVQGRKQKEAELLKEKALALEDAGCFSMVLELIISNVAREITEALAIPTIGIGSGKFTSGQVLVINDLLGMNLHFHPRHAKKYANLAKTITEALNTYRLEVENNSFPSEEESVVE